jgi:hypothetical protein
MSEEELHNRAVEEIYKRVIALREEADKLLADAMDLPATIELCVFAGKFGAVLDVLVVLEAAGAPICDPDEEPHLLDEGRAAMQSQFLGPGRVIQKYERSPRRRP